MANISNNDIARAIYMGVQHKHGKELSSYIESVVQFLNRKRLWQRKEEILHALQKIIHKENGVREVKIKSASKLSKELRDNITHELKKKYKAKEIILKETINEKLLGGFRIEIEDELIDLSLKARMKKLQEHLTRPV